MRINIPIPYILVLQMALLTAPLYAKEGVETSRQAVPRHLDSRPLELSTAPYLATFAPFNASVTSLTYGYLLQREAREQTIPPYARVDTPLLARLRQDARNKEEQAPLLSPMIKRQLEASALQEAATKDKGEDKKSNKDEKAREKKRPCKECEKLFSSDLSSIKKVKEDSLKAKAKSGFYLGVDTYGAILKHNDGVKSTHIVPAQMGITLGMATFFTKNVGVRGYILATSSMGKAYYTRHELPSRYIYVGEAFAGFDFIYELGVGHGSYLGLYGGVGGAIAWLVPAHAKKVSYDADLMANVGITALIATHTRLDFGARFMPSISLAYEGHHYDLGILPYLSLSYKF